MFDVAYHCSRIGRNAMIEGAMYSAFLNGTSQISAPCPMYDRTIIVVAAVRLAPDWK